MVAAPPATLAVGSTVEVTVEEDIGRVHEQVVALLGRHLDSLTNLKRIVDKWPSPSPHLLLGVGKEEFQRVQAGLCDAGQALVDSERHTRGTHVLTASERVRYSSLLTDSGCARGTGNAAPIQLPAFAANREVLAVRVQCLDENGGRQPETTVPLTTYCPAPKPEEAGYFIAHLPAVPAGCVRKTYELRVDEPFVDGVRDFARDHPMPPEVRSAIDATRLRVLHGSSPSPDEVLEGVHPLRECLADEKTKDWPVAAATCPQLGAKPTGGGGKPTEADLVGAAMAKSDALEAATRALQIALSDLGSRPVADWVTQWLWLTSGQPRLDPFQSRVGTLRDLLKARTAELSAIEARLESLQSFTVQLQTPSAVTELMTHLGTLRGQRDLLKRQINQLEGDVADQTAPWLQDSLLYRGLLFPSVAGGPLAGHHDYGLFGRPMVALMQHHDAAGQYMVMGAGPVREVRETERVFVLVENERVDTPLKIEVTVTPITLDLTHLSEEAARSTEKHGAPVARSWTGARDALIKRHDELDLLFRLAVEQLRPPVAWRAIADDTPELTTRNIAYEAPASAPATVAYTITKGKGDSAETVWKGGYRFNKLYWLRLRAGLTFSWLERSEFTETEDGAFTEKRGRYGADGTFGAQLYPFGRRDIRNPTRGERLWPVAYIGLSMKDPLNNFFLGGGWEPVAGLTAIVGKHVGRSQKLENGAVRDAWPSAWFTSVIFDVDFFKRLFSLKLDL
jgi:hypothetical protein